MVASKVVERLQVGATLLLVVLGLFACRGGKSDDTANPPATTATDMPAASAAPSETTKPAKPETTATATITAPSPAPGTPEATVDYVPHPDDSKKCPDGFVGIPNRCARLCKTAKDCHSGHKCEILPPEYGDQKYCADGTWE